MTEDEFVSSSRYLSLDKSISSDNLILFDIHSYDEFEERINFLLSRIKKNDENFFGFSNEEEKTEQEKLDYILAEMLLGNLRKIDNAFYKKMESKYKFKKNRPQKMFANMLGSKEELLKEIGCHISSKANNKIELTTIMSAVYKIYVEQYNMSSQEAMKKLKETLEVNKTAYEKRFPQRMMINDEYEIMLGQKNKFDQRSDSEEKLYEQIKEKNMIMRQQQSLSIQKGKTLKKSANGYVNIILLTLIICFVTVTLLVMIYLCVEFVNGGLNG